MSRENGGCSWRGRSVVIAAAVSSLVWAGVCAQETAGDPVRGKQLFYDHACYSCHGYNGETGARDLVATGSPIIENEALFVAFLRAREGVEPPFSSTGMPSYPQTTLSDAEVRDLFAYVRTFRLDAPNVDDVPALRAVLESAARPSEHRSAPSLNRSPD